MSDFFQNGRITTLHNLSTRSLEQMEEELISRIYDPWVDTVITLLRA